MHRKMKKVELENSAGRRKGNMWKTKTINSPNWSKLSFLTKLAIGHSGKDMSQEHTPSGWYRNYNCVWR